MTLETLISDALEICAVPAPTFAEEDRARLVAAKLEAAGARPGRDETGNVIARFGPPRGAATIVAAHLDTVFPADTPIAPERDGDVLRGPGIGDDSLGVAALIHLARRLARVAPERPVVLAATVGEEGLGDLRGARALVAAVPCRAFVALEGHGLDTLQTAGIASARLRLAFTGPGGHSWGDREQPSAVHALLAAGHAALGAAAGGHVNVGTVAGGTAINAIAARAEAAVDLRDRDDAALDRRLAVVERAVREATPRGIDLEIERVGRRPGGATPSGHPLVQAARAARRAAGLPRAEETASSTDANAALGAGLPAISVALTRGAHAHRPDEHVELGPLEAGVAALEHLVDALGAR